MMDSRLQIRVLGRGFGDAVEWVMAHRMGDHEVAERAIQRLLDRLGESRTGIPGAEAASLRQGLADIRVLVKREPIRVVGRLEPLAASLCRFFAMEDVSRAGKSFESGQFQLAALFLEVASDAALKAIELEVAHQRDKKTGILVHEARRIACGYLARTRASEALRPTIDTLRLVLESMGRMPRASGQSIGH
jgi:hypothetical protein